MFKNRHTGMTMIELIIVIAIVAILVALAIPSFTVYFEKARLRGAADDIVALLAEARQAAVRENKQVGMSVMLTGTNWCVGANPAADPPAAGDPIPNADFCDCSVPAACGLRALSAASYRGVSRPAGADTWFRFDPKLGTLVSMLAVQPILLQSQSGDFQLRVNVSPLGHARICRPAGAGIITGYPAC